MPLRAVIYARYSSDLQRKESIADQVELCRRYAEQQGWTVTAIYHDATISGANRMRPSFQRLLADAETDQFDMAVCEAIDRPSFARVQLHTVKLGLVTAMHIGIMGTIAQMWLSDLGDKVERGQLGQARAGRIPGGPPMAKKRFRRRRRRRVPLL